MKRDIGFRLFNTCIYAAILVGAGCKSIGPAAIKRDRLHYSTAVSDSWKEQLLLNIVKTRYGDAPAFMEVVSVVSGYSLETGVSLNGQFSPENLRGDTFVAGGVSGTYTDRPTISYSPLTGEKFARSLMAPTPLDALWLVIQGGVPVDFLLGLTVQSFEGHHNLGLYAGQYQTADPEFTRLLELLRALQQARISESEVVKQADGVELSVTIHSVGPSQKALAKQVAEVKSLLGVPLELNHIKIVFGTVDPAPDVVGIRTRSLMQILSTLGAGVEIPEEHRARGGIVPVDAAQTPQGFTVHSDKKKPEDPFAAVPYEGCWFWVDRSDLTSKMSLAFVTVLFNFLEGGEKSSPVLTIPAN